MAAMPVSLIYPSVVVFARVSGFPWWPAVVGKCPSDEQWQKNGKFWVVFFNESNGAWLKPSELRTFDDYNIDSCLEYNSTANKFRRYKEKIEIALNLAKEYAKSSRNPRVKVLPLSREEGGKKAALRAVPMNGVEDGTPDGSVVEVEMGRSGRGKKRIQSGKSHVQRAKRGKVQEEDQADTSEEIDEPDGEVGDARSRPRRKRMRSTRYEDFVGSLDERNGDKRRQGVSTEQRRDPMVAESTTKGSTVAVIPYDPIGGTAIVDSKHRYSNPVKVNPVDSGGVRGRGTPSLKVTTRTTRGSLRLTENNTIVQNGDASKHANQRASTKKSLSKRLAQEPMRRMHSEQNNRSDPAQTRELYISELKDLIRPRASQNIAERGRNMHRAKQLFNFSVAGNSEPGSSVYGEGTDSDDRPERLRRVVNGSLEAAAADLVEHAVKGGQGEESESANGREDILDMGCLSLGGSELLTSILNRIRDLEKDVAVLRQKSAGDRQETLGEDASAAGLKSAVEALAAAASAFAKARDYDMGAIGRSIDLLWPSDDHFPLAGADGELLRTMSTSLVLGFCRRRKKEFREQKSKTSLRQRGRDSPGAPAKDLRQPKKSALKVRTRSKEISAAHPREAHIDVPLGRRERESSSSMDRDVVIVKPKTKQQPAKCTKRPRSQVEVVADNVVEEELEGEVNGEDSEEVVDGEGDNVDEEIEMVRSRIP